MEGCVLILAWEPAGSESGASEVGIRYAGRVFAGEALVQSTFEPSPRVADCARVSPCTTVGEEIEKPRVQCKISVPR